MNSTNPASLFGGTWEQIRGRFLIGAGANDANTTDYWGHEDANHYNMPAGELGGEAYHTLTREELPSGTVINRNPTKSVGIPAVSRVNMTINPGTWAFASNYDFSQHEGVTLYNTPHNNMPPYMAVYMWQRTA